MKPDTVHDLQRPIYSKRYILEDLSMNLPLEASLVGMTLTFQETIPDEDPVYLKDKYGHILFEWTSPPSVTEVREVSLRYLEEVH